MIVPISLYINLENTLISRELFPSMLSGNPGSYINAFETMHPDIALIAPAKDWVMLALANPKSIELLKRKKIAIMPTLFSHMLPDAFPEALAAQFLISEQILKRLFENIIWQGIIPENTVSSSIVPFVKRHWQGATLSIGHNNLRGLETGDYFLRDHCGAGVDLQVIANSKARLKYMEMYRELHPANEVIREMNNLDRNHSCLFDFERPWSNIVYYPHEGITPPRMDIWHQFQGALLSHEVSSWKVQVNTNKPSLYLDPADLDMWNNKESFWLIDIQKEVISQSLGKGDYFELAALVATSSMPPRVLTRFMNDDSFPSSYKDKSGIVDLVGDVAKVQELLTICKNIKQRRRIDYGSEFLPAGQQVYLRLLHESLEWIDRILL